MDERYVEARMALDSAMIEFLQAAQAVGFEGHRIGEDVSDSMHEASGGEIKLVVEE